ncbi:BTAD domain-containing putative transcriptional regulator [Streptomyces sp. NPDC057199]|uniref:AfsR/SARP family transcriptional regulator n=1 Tax=Streptomyces sp. NPDC057199 TaxID=3346047 RepID=UPI0036337701
MVELRMLGPIELAVGGRAVEVGPPQRRTVLAALAVDVGRPVTTDVMLERVWGMDPPQGARRAVYAHIARIRRVCEQTGGADEPLLCLVRRSGGYLLDAAPEQVDVHRFRRLIDRARGPGQPDGERVLLLREALGLWRGEPLAGLDGPWAVRVREAWRRRRVDAAIGWAHAELRIGDPLAVIGLLPDLLGEYPLVEPLAEVLMRALHAVGRGAEALDHYAAIRQRLAEELGADPGPGLREAHRAILQGHPSRPSSRGTRGQPQSLLTQAQAQAQAQAQVLSAQTPVAPPTTRWPASPATWPTEIPAQLPIGVRGFTGRGEELVRLEAVLAAAAEQSAPVVISAVSGTAGVGKTALAVHWAHRVRETFPDGQLHVNLRGFDPGGSTMDPAEAVRGFLDAFGVPPARVPAGLEAQVGLYRSLLAGRRVLVVLDNARDAEQVRPLLPGAPGCLALVTSRNRLTSLVAVEGAQLLTVDLLARAEARDLLTGRLGADRVAAEPAAVEEIVARCAGLPLALAVVAARAAAQPHLPLGALAGELREAGSPLDALDGGDPATQVRAVFSWSYRTLSADAARLFRLLGLHPGPDIALPGVAGLAGVPAGRARALMAELTRAHLLTEHAPGRYACHDLLRAYATELVDTVDTETDRYAATHRMLDHYLHTARTADALLTPYERKLITLPPALPGAAPEEPSNHQEAKAWFVAEHPVLLAAIERAPATGFDTHAWQLASTLTSFLDRHGYWPALAAAQATALDSARRRGDRAGQANAHRGFGIAQDRLDHPDDARTHYQLALDLFGELGSHPGQARAHLHLARLSGAQGDSRQALGHAHHSLGHSRAADDRAGQSAALNHIGWFRARLGDHHRALTDCRQALALTLETGDLHSQGHTWDSLGYILRHLGRYEEAVDCYGQALALFRRTGDRHSEATGLAYLGDTHDTAADPEAARTAWTRARVITEELGLPDTDPLRSRILKQLMAR